MDRIIRFLLGVVFFLAGMLFLSGTLQIVAYVLAAIAFFTAFFRFCGLYTILGVSTCPVEESPKPTTN